MNRIDLTNDNFVRNHRPYLLNGRSVVTVDSGHKAACKGPDGGGCLGDAW